MESIDAEDQGWYETLRAEMEQTGEERVSELEEEVWREKGEREKGTFFTPSHECTSKEYVLRITYGGFKLSIQRVQRKGNRDRQC